VAAEKKGFRAGVDMAVTSRKTLPEPDYRTVRQFAGYLNARSIYPPRVHGPPAVKTGRRHHVPRKPALLWFGPHTPRRAKR